MKGEDFHRSKATFTDQVLKAVFMSKQRLVLKHLPSAILCAFTTESSKSNSGLKQNIET